MCDIAPGAKIASANAASSRRAGAARRGVILGDRRVIRPGVIYDGRLVITSFFWKHYNVTFL